MGFFTAKQFSERWGISERRIIKLCQENRISGAEKNGMVWLIPEHTIKPSDKRNKISKYINTQKRIMVVNINTDIGHDLIPILKKEGFIVEGICSNKDKVDKEKIEEVVIREVDYDSKVSIEGALFNTEKYYDGLVFIDNGLLSYKELIIEELAQKMNCESSIVIINYSKEVDNKIEVKMADKLKKNIGLRINALNIDIPKGEKVLVNYKEIAEDIMQLLIKFKNTTGTSITTDGGYIKFDKNGKTEALNTGEFYKAINYYFRNLNKDSYMWCASTMLEDEWTESPLEMNFRVINLEAANRGTKIERIFMFSKNKIKEFKNNKTLNIYMQSNINTMFVDYDEINAKEPELLKIVGEGWDGIDTETLIVDLPNESEGRGYININKKEVLQAYNCFQTLKKYAKDLKEVLK